MTKDSWVSLFLAWLVAATASLGALFVGEVMGQTPCVLCWHQRAFMFPLAVILTIATYRNDAGIWFYALPLALIGGAIAAYHMLLYAGIIPEAIQPCGEGPSCSDAQMTIFGLVPLPALSLGAFALIAILMLVARQKAPQ